MRKTMKGLTQGATRLLVLALGLGLVSTAWANTDLQVTITDSTVVIDNDNAETFDHMTFYVNSPVVTIPASETLPLGTQIELTSISFGKRASGTGNTRPNTLSITGTDGTVYTSEAIVESGTFTKAGCTKEVYSFADKGCVLTVGLSYAMSFKNSDGSDFGTLVSRTAKNSASLFGTTVYNSSYTIWLPVQELTGEIVGSTDFTLVTGDTTDIKNTDTTKPMYLHNAAGWISTGTASSGEIKLVNGPAGYALSVNNGNSIADNNKNRTSVWKKLSGDGLLTTANNNWQTPAVKIYDASEFTGSINASAGNVRLAVIFCAEADTFSPSVYEEIGSKSGLIYIKSGTSVTVAEGATWTAVNGIVNKGALTVNGTVASAISNVGGTVTVNAGASVPSFGSQRDFTGFTIHSSVPVKITMTSEEYGKGSVSVTGASGISTITVLAPDGTTTVGTITPAESSTLETGVKVSGKACWIDYEMAYGGGKSGFENTGTSNLGLQKDSGIEGSDAFTDDGMLYTYAHPYRQSLTMPSTWTAVVRCTVPNYSDAAVIMFGWNNNYIGLVAGETPKTEMRLVQYKTGYDHYVTNAVMTVQDATTAQHVYIFAVENSQTLKVYCDGSMILDKVLDEPLTITSGFQIGSVLGGATGGIVRFAKNETPASSLAESVQKDARIDCVRLYDYSLSADQRAALTAEFPAVKLYEATVAANADTTWGDLHWSNDWDGGNEYSKVLLNVAGDAMVALPESIEAEELAFDVEPGSTLTLKGPGSLAVTRAIDAVGFTLKLAGTVTLAADTTFAGNVVFSSDFAKVGEGAIRLANGATVGVEDALVVTPLGSYTLAQGTVVDSVYTGDGVKLIPLTSVVVSITQNGTTLYYSDLDTGVGTLDVIDDVSNDVRVELLNGTTWPTTPSDCAGILRTRGYYIDGNGILTKAVAKISSTPYQTLAAAVAAASDSATVTLLLNSSEAITLNKAITLDENGKTFSGTLTGNGALTFAAFRNNPSITFDSWSGSVVLPSFAANGTILNKYGVTNSTVVLKGITGGWLGETSTQRMDVNPVLQLDGNVTITGFSQAWTYTFAEITGTGTFALDPTDNHPHAASITKVAAGFSGSIYSDIDTTLTIGTIDREAGTQVTGGMKLLTTSGSGDITATTLTVGGVAQGVTLCTESDGIYVVAASVQKGENTPTIHTTVAAAMTEAGSDPATITLLANTSSDIALAVGQSLVTGGFSVGTVSTGATYYHVVNNTGVYTVVLDTHTITIPPVANTTVSVSYTSGGEAQVATTAGAITVDAGTSLTATWTAASGYKITTGASQTINPVAAAETLTSPTVDEKRATVSGVTFDYGDDFATADVTATVSGDATTYTLTVGGANYEGAVSGSTVTFSDVVTGRADAYDSFDYTISATDGTSSVAVSDGSGSAIVAKETDWIRANADRSVSGGEWDSSQGGSVTSQDGKLSFEGTNTFAATSATAGDIVKIEAKGVVFNGENDEQINTSAQGAVKIASDGNGGYKFNVLTGITNEGETWAVATNSLTPSVSVSYDIVVTFYYNTENSYYTVHVNGDVLAVEGNTHISNAQSSSAKVLHGVGVLGSGSMTSLVGTELEGNMVVDKDGTKYATIAAAVQAYAANSNIGPLKRLHPGTLPDGWTYDDETGELRYTSVVVVSDEERTLVAVPRACKADELIDLSNRYKDDELMVYVMSESCYYTWTLDENTDWKPSLTFVTLGEEQSVNSTEASDVDLAPGQAVWLTRKSEISKSSPIKLLVVPTGDPVQVAVEEGWNIVAPLPKADNSDFDAKTVKAVDKDEKEVSFEADDQIVVPTTAAPKTYVQKDGVWKVQKQVNTSGGDPSPWGTVANPVWSEAETIPVKAGQGFWFKSSSGDKKLKF